MESNLLLFMHPTTWVFVDDQEQFLNAIELALPNNQPYTLWSNPLECLEKVNQSGSQLDPAVSARSVDYSNEDILVKFELDQITRLPTHADRFASIGVVVADYAMPGLSGLELLEAVDDQKIKKILLTGVADEKVAVEAFNRGLIDRFVLKSEPQAMEMTLRYCQELSMIRTEEAQAPLIGMLPHDFRILFQNDELRAFMDEQFASKGICEYYFSSKPLGFYCLDSEGAASFIALVTNDQLASTIRSLDRISAPADVVRGMSSGQSYACLFEESYLEESADYDWDYNTVRLQPIPGLADIYWGLHDSPPLDVDFDPSACSLHAYLAETQES